MKIITVYYNVGGSVNVKNFQSADGVYSIQRVVESPSALGTRKTMIKLGDYTFDCDSWSVEVETV